jgi:crotonobetainyl-CoA:carnitine CoA-transferase CaiB-like acyl-CoA transferase
MSGLLDGMRVLDAGIWRPMPYATQLLADLGAEVTKIEPPTGDPMRGFPELFRDVASNKRSVRLDLRTEEGRRQAQEMAAAVDVFCEGWRPGVADRLGVGYGDLCAVNPSIIYCSLSGFGQDGDLVARPGHDLNYQALAGALVSRRDDDTMPAIPRVPVADLAAGLFAAFAISAAYAKRVQTGEGERIDVAMADVVASWVGPYASTALADSDEPMRGAAGYGAFRCADGTYLALGVIAEDHFWRAVCDALELVELADLTYVERLGKVEACNDAVARQLANIPRDDALSRLIAAGAPVTPVLTPDEMGADPNFRGRGVIVEDPDGGRRVAFPAVLHSHPPRPPGAAPPLPD